MPCVCTEHGCRLGRNKMQLTKCKEQLKTNDSTCAQKLTFSGGMVEKVDCERFPMKLLTNKRFNDQSFEFE